MMPAYGRRVSPRSEAQDPIAVCGVVAETGRVRGGCGRWMWIRLRDPLLWGGDLVLVSS